MAISCEDEILNATALPGPPKLQSIMDVRFGLFDNGSFKSHTSDVKALCCASRLLPRFFTSSRDSSIKGWEFISDQWSCTHDYRPHAGFVNALAFAQSPSSEGFALFL